MSEKLCLKWNDFQENIKSSFGSLREDTDFTDVTLACEDGQQVEAHKVILAASSPFFQKLLGRNKHLHPLVYMRGMKSDDLLAIVDFLYRGEAKVYQDNLDSFLAIAEELQLKGLMGKQDGRDNNFVEDENPISQTSRPDINTDTKIPEMAFKGQVSSRIRQQNLGENRTLAIPGDFSGDLAELENRVKSMMEKSRNKYANGRHLADRCKVCGKEGMGSAIKDHIEAKHLEGIIIPCNLCDKTFRCRNGLRKHLRQHESK